MSVICIIRFRKCVNSSEVLVLHNEGLYNSYTILNIIIMVIKSNRSRWAGHVALAWKIRKKQFYLKHAKK